MCPATTAVVECVVIFVHLDPARWAANAAGSSQSISNTSDDTGRIEIVPSEGAFVRTMRQLRWLGRHSRGWIGCANCVGWDYDLWTERTGSCEALLEIVGARRENPKVLPAVTMQTRAVVQLAGVSAWSRPV